MPELPEVLTIQRQLANFVIGKKIARVEKLHPKTFEGDIDDIRGAKIKNIRRRAKILILDLDNGKSLLMHLKMTGQLIYEGENERAGGGHPVPPLNSPLPNKSTRIVFHFEDNARIYFNDLRLFAYARIIPTSQVEKEKAIREFGPEPFDQNFTPDWLSNALTKKTTKIKALLLDQTFISGLGNIYSDEALYCAKIHPTKPANRIDAPGVSALFGCIQKVLKLGIKAGGASDNSYVNAKGLPGRYMRMASVYHQKTCPKGHHVSKLKMNGRTAHFCAIEQK
ncbi:bifunctional DNA-formamidopyrimidine glycosylase/DNA-(apurinic or apyrimidinic site) lyase [Candidatus Berkelbacteria bacterium]|nr:bifunctional DNA-formamidopyrimidine glycosylase/DNA-(apurinic or apyrimidinic site) lyase [Candidatus Berkelbacteria bacterium]